MCCAAAAAVAVIASSESVAPRQNSVGEEMHLITKSLEDLLGELALIKREANGRLSSVKNRVADTSDQERIRQTKVSRFVLRRIAELESESLGMREELARLFAVTANKTAGASQPTVYSATVKLSNNNKQATNNDDDDFFGSTTAAPSGMPASSTAQPSTAKPTEEEEAAKLGFDMEALKKLGEEIGKRLDQFGKDAAKNLGDLLDGVKLVFREPRPTQRPAAGADAARVAAAATAATQTLQIRVFELNRQTMRLGRPARTHTTDASAPRDAN